MAESSPRLLASQVALSLASSFEGRAKTTGQATFYELGARTLALWVPSRLCAVVLS
jgi:hypothetical protein